MDLEIVFAQNREFKKALNKIVDERNHLVEKAKIYQEQGLKRELEWVNLKINTLSSIIVELELVWDGKIKGNEVNFYIDEL